MVQASLGCCACSTAQSDSRLLDWMAAPAGFCLVCRRNAVAVHACDWVTMHSLMSSAGRVVCLGWTWCYAQGGLLPGQVGKRLVEACFVSDEATLMLQRCKRR